VLLSVKVGSDGVLGPVHVGLNGARGALLEVLLEADIVLVALLQAGVALLALLAVEVCQLLVVLRFEPSGKTKGVDRARGRRAYTTRRCASVHRYFADAAKPIPKDMVAVCLVIMLLVVKCMLVHTRPPKSHIRGRASRGRGRNRRGGMGGLT
jgi:hypothetical protein